MSEQREERAERFAADLQAWAEAGLRQIAEALRPSIEAWNEFALRYGEAEARRRAEGRCGRSNPHLSHVTGEDGMGDCPGLPAAHRKARE